MLDMPRRWRLIAPLAVGSIALVAGLAAYLLGVHHTWSPTVPGASQMAFVDDRSCAQCHQAQYRAWAGSHHDRAMQRADERAVLGDFNDARFTHLGVTSRFFKRDGRFFVNTAGADGTLADFEITHTLGVAPLQQYLIGFPGGRLQSFTMAWDTGKQRWLPLYTKETIAPGKPLHWTGRYQNWNLMCAECHTTNLRKGYDPSTDSYRTTWSALNVGCQACHGPGEAHLAWAQAGTRAKDADDTGLLVNFRTNDSRYQVDACARCHARRTRLVAGDRPGRPLLDDFRPELLRADLYYADGQQLAEVYEYGSFRQSRMYQRGVRCTDCHDPHSGKLRAADDALCTRCHGGQPAPRFPTMPVKPYDSTAHHFHAPGSAGARCVGCHMPSKNYMVVHARRDHSLRIPRPDLSAKLGTPNACNGCHRDRSSRWAAAAVEKWWGPAPQQRNHYAEVMAAGRTGARAAESKLVALAGNTDQPAIVRATALDLLRGYGPTAATAAIRATKDEDPVVRGAAVSGLERLPPRERFATAAPLLQDAIRAVRIEAARVLATVPAELFDAPQGRAFDAALAELKDAHQAMADMPSAQLNLAGVYEDLGERDLAERGYQAALRMDPDFFPGRINLARLYNAMRRNADAERTLREGITRTPGQGELHYALGLLLADAGRVPEAADVLREAARLLPGRARVRYNYGVMLQQLGRHRDAEAVWLRAHGLDRGDPGIAYALAVLYLQQRQFGRALTYARLFADLTPQDPRGRGLIAQIEQARAQTERR